MNTGMRYSAQFNPFLTGNYYEIFHSYFIMTNLLQVMKRHSFNSSQLF